MYNLLLVRYRRGIVATIKDIAREAGVSVTTVSRALNDYYDVSQETKDIVRRVAKELNYVPNRAAKSLVTKENKSLAIIFSSLEKAGANQGIIHFLITGMIDYAKEIDYEVLIYTTDTKHQKDKSYLQFCNEHQIGGAVIYGIRLDDPYFNEIVESDIPTVLVDVDVETTGKNSSTISINNKMAAKDATELLIQNNHRHIGMVNGSKEAYVSVSRLAGYKEALNHAGIDFCESYVEYADFLEEIAHKRTVKLLKSHPEITAIFCSSDLMAIGAIEAVKELGLNVPEDISIIGFDDIPLAKYLTPSLSSVKQDFFSSGYYAAKQLYNTIKGESVKKNIYLEYKVLARNSIRCLN